MTDSKMIFRAIIADDELLARNVIKKYLTEFPQVEIVAECENGLTALNKINRLHPDLVFLDIEMPELDGLSLLNELEFTPMIVFTTAYNQYAIKAFELNAVDYLLKPFDRSRFSSAVQKVLRQKTSPGNLQAQLDQLQKAIGEIKTGKKFTTRILIKGNNTYSFLNVNEIMWFQAYSDYVKIHTKEKFYLKNISLNELEAKLDTETFVRIHRSTIVNFNFIKKMQPYFNGEYYIYLTNGEKLKLSRSYKDKIKFIIDDSI